MPVQQVRYIQFSILSPDEIVRFSSLFLFAFFSLHTRPSTLSLLGLARKVNVTSIAREKKMLQTHESAGEAKRGDDEEARAMVCDQNWFSRHSIDIFLLNSRGNGT